MNRHALASLICLPLAACVADTEPEEDTETLNTTESDLCTDGAADAVVPFKDHQGFSGATSPSLSSNYDRAACGDRYSVEITGVGAATQPFSITGGWGEPLPVSEEVCPLALGNIQAQEYRMTGFNCSGSLCFPTYGWVNIGGDIALHGEWKHIFGTAYECQLVPSAPLPTLQPSAFRSKVRVSVRAYAWAVFFPAYKKATAGVYSNYIIY